VEPPFLIEHDGGLLPTAASRSDLAPPNSEETPPLDLRERIFNARSYTPIPILVAAVILAETTVTSFVAGLGTAILGEAVRVWAVGYAGSATPTTRGVGGEVLVVSGPYAHVRNPLYVGNFFLSLGVCIMAWAWMPWMLLLYVALFVAQYAMIVSLEEEHLRAEFGEAYEVYAAKVPRFVPRIAPYRSGQTLDFRLGSTLRSERSTFGNVLLCWVILGLRWSFG